MKITVETIEKDQEEEIRIRCHEINDEVISYMNRLKSENQQLMGYEENDIHRLSFDEVFYFEAVDNKVFLYTRDKVYECKQKLYELEEMCRGKSFFRCSKSVILNIEKIKLVHPYFGGRFEAQLENQETVIVSRQYVPLLKQKLGLGGVR